MSKLFEQATRAKLRFLSPVGKLSVEDLWELPLTTTKSNGNSLNRVAQLAATSLRDAGEENFVGASDPNHAKLELRLDIVKYIIKVRQEENQAKVAAKSNETFNENLDAIIAAKRLDEMKSMSTEELEKLRK